MGFSAYPGITGNGEYWEQQLKEKSKPNPAIKNPQSHSKTLQETQYLLPPVLTPKKPYSRSLAFLEYLHLRADPKNTYTRSLPSRNLRSPHLHPHTRIILTSWGSRGACPPCGGVRGGEAPPNFSSSKLHPTFFKKDFLFLFFRFFYCECFFYIVYSLFIRRFLSCATNCFIRIFCRIFQTTYDRLPVNNDRLPVTFTTDCL